MRSPLLLLAIISIAAAACSGQISQYVPAVVGSSGGLVNVTVSLVPGPGNVYVTVTPRTGLTTQDSIQSAVEYAYAAAGMQQSCDVLVNFDSADTSYIDGPSAGTALSVMTFALLENRTMRNDTIITGTIDPVGLVGPVGGLYEKATGAAAFGARYFITPVDDIYEVLLLRNVEERYNITVIQASKVSDVIGFMLDNLSITQESGLTTNRTIPDLPVYDSSGQGAFATVAQQMIGMENDTTQSISGTDNDSMQVKGFFSNEVLRQQAILQKGYYFSAANEAFLNYIDLSTIKVILAGQQPDIPGEKGQVGICLTGIKRPAMTDQNFEWIIGSDQRQSWAWDKLTNTTLSDQALEDEKFADYNALMYGQAWCDVAKTLISEAPGGGRPIDESAWKDIATKYLGEARATNITSPDTASRVGIAQTEYDKGLYGAAIYDSVYVITTETAPTGNDTNDPVLRQNRSSLWGRVYQSHATYLLGLNQTGAAIQTAEFASALDQATAEMVSGGRYLDNTPQPLAGGSNEAQPDYTILIVGAIVILLLVIALIVLLGKTHGNNGQGPIKAYRTKQKKG